MDSVGDVGKHDSAHEVTTQILAKIAEAQELPLEKVGIESSFEELGIDSLNGFNLLCDLEEALDITIPDDEARQLSSVRQLVDCIVPLTSSTR